MRVALLLSAMGLAVRGCEDLTLDSGDEWHDADDYTCATGYSTTKKCERYGSKYAFEDKTANDACCTCGGGSTAGAVGECTADESWEHPKYGDTCADYAVGGGSYKYRCDVDVKDICCSCASSSSSSAGGECTADESWEHPKYGDTCADYAVGGGSYKYRCASDVKDICCSCETENKDTSATCVVDNSWEHPKYKDSCIDYISGGSMAYNCIAEAKSKCCTCSDAAPEVGGGTCKDMTNADGSDWHDETGPFYTCEYYGKPGKNRCENDGSKYAFEGVNANSACCACGGGQGQAVCTDKKLASGGDFHDSGGASYDCAYYGKNAAKRCGPNKDGSKYANEGLVANDACCSCGGGDKDTEGKEEELGLTDIKPDEGDAINFEWIDGIKYYQKKHLGGGMIMYWNTDTSLQTIEVALVGPPDWDGSDRWIAIGFSQTGGMAGSDAVVAWFDSASGDAAKILDVHLINQSPSGISIANKQSLTKTKLLAFENRNILRFTRPWSPVDGRAIKPTQAFVDLIYAQGKVSSKCTPFCNHISTERWMTGVAMTAPAGLKMHDLNKGIKDEPCQGLAALECADGFSCYHDVSLTGDNFAADWVNYGRCVDPETLGDEGDDDSIGVQNVFINGGGFENEKALGGGFVLLWTVTKVSAPGSASPDDAISLALVSTSSKRQGWIGFGFSPNGLMMGSDVVVGWNYNGEPYINEYFLEAQVSSANTPNNKQNMTDERIILKNGQTAIMFKRPLYPADSVQIMEGAVHIIYASGPVPTDADAEEQFIPYHRYRKDEDVAFIPYASDYEYANAVGEMGICDMPGEGGAICQPDLVCFLLPDEFFDVDWDGMMEEAGEDDSGFTENSDWTDDEMSDTPFADIEQLRGKGICITPGQMDAASDFDFSKMGEAQVVDTTDFSYYKKLRFGFDLFWSFVGDDRIKIALIASIGPGWIGMGFGTQGAMIGATAVCGWKEFGNETNTKVDEYYLNNKLPWEIKSIHDTPEFMDMSVEPSEMAIFNLGHENAIIFERPLEPSNGHAPIREGELTQILFAVGDVPNPQDQFFGYHRFRDGAKIDFFDETQVKGARMTEVIADQGNQMSARPTRRLLQRFVTAL